MNDALMPLCGVDVPSSLKAKVYAQWIFLAADSCPPLRDAASYSWSLTFWRQSINKTHKLLDRADTLSDRDKIDGQTIASTKRLYTAML